MVERGGAQRRRARTDTGPDRSGPSVTSRRVAPKQEFAASYATLETGTQAPPGAQADPSCGFPGSFQGAGPVFMAAAARYLAEPEDEADDDLPEIGSGTTSIPAVTRTSSKPQNARQASPWGKRGAAQPIANGSRRR